MKRYYKQENGTTLISNTPKDGYIELSFAAEQDWMNGGCPSNIIWESGMPRLMTADEIATKIEADEIASVSIVKKLDIRRAMRKLGIEAKLDALLTNVEFKKDWDDATEINLKDDPMVQAAMVQLDVDVVAIKKEIIRMNKARL